MNDTSQMSHTAAPSTRYITTGVRLAIGGALLAFAFSRGGEVGKVFQIIRTGNPVYLFTAIAIAILGELITAVKWRLLIQSAGGAIPLPTVIRASFIGMFYNNFFPGSVGGDIVRVLLIARYAGGKARATASAFMQRNTGLAGLFVIGIPAAILWPMFIELTGKNVAPLWMRDCRTWLIAAAAGYIAVNAILFSRRAYGLLWSLLHRLVSQPHHRHFATRTISLVFQKLQRFHAELHGFRFWLTAPLVLSAVTQLVDILMVWNLAHAIQVDIPFHVLLVAVPFITLSNLLPVTINGIGLRETMYVALLVPVGIAASQALALSLLHFGVIITLSAVGGVVHWLSKP